MRRLRLVYFGLAAPLTVLFFSGAPQPRSPSIRFVDSGQRLGSSNSYCVELADVDGDGDLDAFFANGEGPSRLWLNDGTARFSDSGQEFASGGCVVLGDLDGDGDTDALLAGSESRVLLNDGRGRYEEAGLAVETESATGAALGDLDGDGDLDAFVANSSHAGKSDPANKVWLGDGSGRFTDSGQSLGDAYSLDVALGDLDGDGHLDAYVGNYRAADRVWLNDGTGRFTDSGLRLGESNGHGVALGDLDGDGDLDAFVANNTWQGGDGANRVWICETTRIP